MGRELACLLDRFRKPLEQRSDPYRTMVLLARPANVAKTHDRGSPIVSMTPRLSRSHPGKGAESALRIVRVRRRGHTITELTRRNLAKEKSLQLPCFDQTHRRDGARWS